MTAERNIRLFVDRSLNEQQTVPLSEAQSHYLINVMRCRQGDCLCCFDGQSGEYQASIAVADKKNTVLNLLTKTRELPPEPDIWLLFAPLKKDKTDFVIAKAVELGAAKIVPVITARTNAERIKIERYQAQAIEAAEQCGRLSVPTISEPLPLKKLLQEWDPQRILFFMDEHRQGSSAKQIFSLHQNEKSAILIGPEGGFAPDETASLNACAFVKNVSLGPRILRAETAAVAALAVWQALAGDC